MNLVELKTAKEITIKNVEVSFVTQDKNLLEIHLHSGGQKFIIKRSDSYSNNIRAYRVDEFQEQDKHVLEGEILGLKISEHFDSEYDAEQRKSEIEKKVEDAKITLSKRKVKISDDGEILTSEQADAVPF